MRIFLIRHGESLGNVDESAYSRLGDHKVPLTDLGIAQAEAAGAFIAQFYARSALADTKLRVWHSPFLRTEQTKDGVIKGLGADRVRDVREDYLLIEQNFGLFSHIVDKAERARLYPAENAMYEMMRAAQGKFYAVPPLGESRMQVTMRTRLFKETLMRDKAKGIEDVIIVAHGVTVRSFEMDFLHLGVQWFEDSPNPGNGDITLIESGADGGYSSRKVFTNPVKLIPAATLPTPAPGPIL